MCNAQYHRHEYGIPKPVISIRGSYSTLIRLDLLTVAAVVVEDGTETDAVVADGAAEDSDSGTRPVQPSPGTAMSNA